MMVSVKAQRRSSLASVAPLLLMCSCVRIGYADVTRSDAGVVSLVPKRPDAGPQPASDAAVSDAAMNDAASSDASAKDAAMQDAATKDAAVNDAAAQDGAMSDAAVQDAGEASVADAGPAADAASADAAARDPIVGAWTGRVTNDPSLVQYDVCIAITQDNAGVLSGSIQLDKGTNTDCNATGVWRRGNLVNDSVAAGLHRFTEVLTYTQSDCAQQTAGFVFVKPNANGTLLWQWSADAQTAWASTDLSAAASCP